MENGILFILHKSKTHTHTHVHLLNSNRTLHVQRKYIFVDVIQVIYILLSDLYLQPHLRSIASCFINFNRQEIMRSSSILQA